MPRAAGSASTTREQLPLARQPERHRSAGRDREDRAVALGRIGQRAVAVVVDDGVGERLPAPRPARARARAPTLTRSFSSPIASPRVAGEEPRAGRLLDVAAPGLEQVLARLHAGRATSSSSSILSTSVAPLVVELRSRRSASGEVCPSMLLDVGLESHRARPRPRRSARATAVRDSASALALALGAGERSVERLDLGATAGGLLADPTADVLDLAPVLLGFAERRLGAGRARARRASSSAIDAGELAPRRARSRRRRASRRAARRRLRRQVLRARPSRARRRSRNACSARSRSNVSGAERLLGVGERARGGGASVRRRRAPRRRARRAARGPSSRRSGPSSQPPWRRSCSRSSARSRAAASLRDKLLGLRGELSRACLAISACCCSGFSWRRSSASTSGRRRRSWSRPASLRSARSLRRRCLAMPAASSMYLRRSSGRARSTSSSWPWPTTVCSARPIPVSRQELLDVHQPDDLAADAVLGLARCGRSCG